MKEHSGGQGNENSVMLSCVRDSVCVRACVGVCKETNIFLIIISVCWPLYRNICKLQKDLSCSESMR